MIIYFDGNCGLCRRTAKWWEKMDWMNKLQFISFRSIENYPQIMEEQLHVFHKHQWYRGYGAFIQIAKMLPLLWVLLPLLYLFKWIGLGDFIYKKVAANRKLVPVNQCTGEKCSVTSRE